MKTSLRLYLHLFFPIPLLPPLLASSYFIFILSLIPLSSLHSSPFSSFSLLLAPLHCPLHAPTPFPPAVPSTVQSLQRRAHLNHRVRPRPCSLKLPPRVIRFCLLLLLTLLRDCWVNTQVRRQAEGSCPVARLDQRQANKIRVQCTINYYLIKMKLDLIYTFS